MVSSEQLQGAGFVVADEGPGLHQWRVDPQQPKRIRRFIAFAQEVVTTNPQLWDRLPALMVVMDGVLPGALEKIRRTPSAPYQAGDKVFLEWNEEDPPRIERRELSPQTAIAWLNACNVQTPANASPPLPAMLRAFVARTETYRNLASPLKELEKDALCWWYQCLPAPFFAHLSTLQPLSALPRSTLARGITCQAVATALADEDSADEPGWDLGLTAEMLDHVEQSQGEDTTPTVLQNAISAMTPGAQESNGITKRRWAQALYKLLPVARDPDPVVCLILGWGLDLIESGTLGQSNLAIATIKKYFSTAAIPLFKLLKVLLEEHPNMESWSSSTLADSYTVLVNAQSAGSQRGMASALTSFHSFLCKWWDINPTPLRLHMDVPSAKVQAQVVWAHEYERVMRWLDEVDDARVKAAAQILLGIAFEAPARTNELLRLRIQNFCVGHDAQVPFMEIEIAPSAFIGRLKTPAAQRRLTIRNVTTISKIQRWLQQRLDEGAPLNALAFAEPTADNRIYRGAAVISLINRLLKAATGEMDVRIHSLRHGAVNTRIAQHLEKDGISDVNRYALVASESGHATAFTTLTSYFHRYESYLRAYIDSALAKLVPLTEAQVSTMLNCKVGTLRKQAQRQCIQLPDYLWMRIRKQLIPSGFPELAGAFAWQTPVCPALLPRYDTKITANVMLRVLDALATGHDIAVVAARYSLVEDDLKRVQETFLTLATEHTKRSRSEAAIHVSLWDALQTLRVRLSSAHQMKFSVLAQWLSEDPPLSVLKSALESWRSCQHGGYLSLANSSEALGLYRMLDAAHVPPKYLRICIQSASPNLETSHRSNQARDVFIRVFGVPPRQSICTPRSGRPNVYLLWDTPKPGGNTASAGSTCHGLDAWMYAISALLIARGVKA